MMMMKVVLYLGPDETGLNLRKARLYGHPEYVRHFEKYGYR